ncbi:MAG: acyl-ACP--UDP-N-acetylglucosamine O-acyltransferase [Oligoflexia bacterium]|nr:acyl-ACP--UDP-N-acetylglucosamine O-acyltransferase [Oligoflexia bacterium]
MSIHPTSIVHPQASIHSSAEIGPWCTIGPNVKIGAGSRLTSHVVVEGHTTIGENNIIFPFAVLGAVPQDLKYKGEPTELIIGNHNTIREGVTMNLGTVQGGGVTSVRDHCLIMGYTHLGHDCILGSHVIISNGSGLAGHVKIEDHVQIGGMCGISQFVHIGAYVYIGGQSGVDRDVPPYSIAMGSRPCIIKGANIVGLRRRGIPAETITKINEALKLWTRSDVQREQCILEIESQFGEVPEIQGLVAFIRKSELGVTR